jgi:hypothetical protein
MINTRTGDAPDAWPAISIAMLVNSQAMVFLIIAPCKTISPPLA